MHTYKSLRKLIIEYDTNGTLLISSTRNERSTVNLQINIYMSGEQQGLIGECTCLEEYAYLQEFTQANH